MARRQVIVQLDDDLVRGLDALARERGVSRSELIRGAAAALLTAAATVREDHRLVDSYRRLPQDPVLVETAARLASETAPPW